MRDNRSDRTIERNTPRSGNLPEPPANDGADNAPSPILVGW